MKLPTLVGLVASLGFPMLLTFGTVAPSPAAVIVPLWTITLLLLLLVRFWEREPLASIGLRPPSSADLAYGVLGFAVGFALLAAAGPLVARLGLRPAGATVSAEPVTPMIVLVLLTSPITEEVLFRGYAVERLWALTGSPALAATLSSVAFLTAHLPFWGLGGALQFLPWTVVINVLYLWRRNLPSCILMHFLGDLTGLAVLPLLGAAS